MNDARAVVESYLEHHFRIVTWNESGDAKGPHEPGWPAKTYTIDDFSEGQRVGLLTGVQVEQGKFLHDVDIDWAEGAVIARTLLPSTGFVFGRKSKQVSHCFYTLPEALATQRFEDIDKVCLIELRGTKTNGEVGLQTMAPPSVWSKNGQREPLIFVQHTGPAHVEVPGALQSRVVLSAIGMLLARHLGKNGFGHEPRLIWAGFLLRLGVGVEDLIKMGEAMSKVTNNLEINDVRRVVESTAMRLTDPNQKIKGGPALARLLGDHGRAVVAKVQEWLGRGQDFIRGENGKIVKDHQENIRRALFMMGRELSYDEFSDKLLVDGQALEDRQLGSLWLRMDEECKFRPSFEFFERVIKEQAWENGFHPVKQYFASLPPWDDRGRAETWLIKCAGAEDSPYVRAVSRIMLVAAVRRILQPGCKYDEILVLESGQGMNKSSALAALCPERKWFSDDFPLNLNSQRLIEATLGKWIIEAADLSGKRKAEIEQLKSMLSRQVDGPARMAYARLAVERARQFILVGTTNSAAYLTDPTGARRFWPVKIEKFDVEKLLTYRDQLWAEALVLEAQGMSIRLPEELWPEAEREQEKRREVDPWEDIIRKLLEMTPVKTDGKIRIPITEIWRVLGILPERQDRYGSLRIGEVMHRLGFLRTRVWVETRAEVGFIGKVDSAWLTNDPLEQVSGPEGGRPGREPGDEDPPF